MKHKIRDFFNDIIFYSSFWGLWNALRIRFFAALYGKIFGKTTPSRQNSVLMELLRKEWNPIVERYKSLINDEAQPITVETPIWVCWWQGEQEMPEVIHQCYKLLLVNRNGHPVHLITQENYFNYVTLPDNIISYVENGTISFTFLSDLLRTSLLAKYGGIWIDATYWVTQPLNINGKKLFTYRQDRFKGQGGINDFKWTCHLIGTGKPYYIFSFLYDCLLHHVELHGRIVAYLLIDFAIELAYESFDDFKTLIDDLPDHKPHIYIMPWLFNQKLDIKYLKEILETTPLLKLTYKQSYVKNTSDGSPTFYDYFMKQNINIKDGK